jgi:hypothetical protein
MHCVRRSQRLLTGLVDFLELLYMVMGGSQVNFSYLDESLAISMSTLHKE